MDACVYMQIELNVLHKTNVKEVSTAWEHGKVSEGPQGMRSATQLWKNTQTSAVGFCVGNDCMWELAELAQVWARASPESA